jgi:hypothetical protein
MQAYSVSSAGRKLKTEKSARPKRSLLSRMDEPCEVCHGYNDAEKMIICDACFLGYHFVGPLPLVPEMGCDVPVES